MQIQLFLNCTILSIIGFLPEPMRTMALLDASTGLRTSELMGLLV